MFYGERNVLWCFVLVPNLRAIALQNWPFCPHSFCKPSRDLTVVLLIYRLSSNHTYSIVMMPLISNKTDMHDRYLMSQIDQDVHFSKPPDLPRIAFAIQNLIN
ncbi:hypothetical protein TNCV_3901221 [Trichonephila clavipes]|nr:hypothetical protein TNCV_3901221 [Trichonephila clavipes]